MLFSSLKPLPAEELGKLSYSWVYKPSVFKSMLLWLVIGSAILALAFLYFILGREHPEYRSYIRTIAYLALLLYSVILPRLWAASKRRRYEVRDEGFIIYIGDSEKAQTGAGWAYWHEFDRAELNDIGVKIFPHKTLLRSVLLPCDTNRLSVYSMVSVKIAESRYKGRSD